MAETEAQNLPDNFNIDTQIIHTLAHLLYSNMNRSCFQLMYFLLKRHDYSQRYEHFSDLASHHRSLSLRIDYGDDGAIHASVHSNLNSSALDCPN